MLRIEKGKEYNVVKVEKRKKKWSDTGKRRRVLGRIGVTLEKGRAEIPPGLETGPRLIGIWQKK